MGTMGRNPRAAGTTKLRTRVQISHLLPVLFLSLAHIFLDMTGWRGAQGGLTLGTLLLNVGLFLLALVMAWGFALSLESWVIAPVRRLAELASSLPGHRTAEEWRPVGWVIDVLARRVLSLLRQNRRGVEALAEVEAVRDHTVRLLKSWGELDLPGGPGLDTRPAEFWRSVRRVLVDRMGDLVDRTKNLAARISQCRESGRGLSRDLAELTIQTESLFLESSHKAVAQNQVNERESNSILDEVRSGLEKWSGEAQKGMRLDTAASLKAWRDWILHTLDEERSTQSRTEAGLEAKLEALSRQVEGLSRRSDNLSQEVESCHILAMEIHGALPALREEEPLAHVT